MPYSREAYNEILEMSDALVAMADRVEDKAFELIARFQPVASDLRTIKSYMKIAYDFARFGDRRVGNRGRSPRLHKAIRGVLCLAFCLKASLK